MFVARGATSGVGTAAKLANIATHASQMRINLVLTLVICFTAFALAVSLYGITRDEDHELSMFALLCRSVEAGVTPVIGMLATMGVLSIASAEAAAADPTAYPVAAFLLKVRGWTPLFGATFFAVGSTVFSWLLLRGRMIPVSLAWLGVAASLLLVVGLPLQMTGVLSGSITQLMWLPMAAFEIPLGFWLLVRGVPPLERTARTH
jgi:hypothetical protein